jgi:hypothetical protein
MAHYLLSVIHPAGRTRPEPEQLAVIRENVEAVHEEMADAGVWVFGGGLAEASSATTVEARDTDPLVVDGPYAEGKEYLGGLSIINVADLDAALEWAEKTSRATTTPIEIRPFLG